MAQWARTRVEEKSTRTGGGKIASTYFFNRTCAQRVYGHNSCIGDAICLMFGLEIKFYLRRFDVGLTDALRCAWQNATASEKWLNFEYRDLDVSFSTRKKLFCFAPQSRKSESQAHCLDWSNEIKKYWRFGEFSPMAQSKCPNDLCSCRVKLIKQNHKNVTHGR